MSWIFMDESGDLGFDFTKKGTTNHFLITFIFLDNKKPIEKCIKKAHNGLRKLYKTRCKVLHAYEQKPATRLRLLRSLAENNLSVITICLNKKKVYTRLQNEKAILYNYVTNILLDRVFTKKLIPAHASITLVASKRETNNFLNLNFKNYLEQQAANNHEINLKILIKTPAEEKALQAVDFISWAIFRKYEYEDFDYYRVIKNLIVEENSLFP